MLYEEFFLMKFLTNGHSFYKTMKLIFLEFCVLKQHMHDYIERRKLNHTRFNKLKINYYYYNIFILQELRWATWQGPDRNLGRFFGTFPFTNLLNPFSPSGNMHPTSQNLTQMGYNAPNAII